MNAAFIDFSNSFVTWETPAGSYGRFNVEAYASVISHAGQKEFYLLSGVFACEVYGSGRLFHNPFYFFQAVFSADEHKIFRTYASQKNRDSWDANNKVFSEIKFSINKKKGIDISSDFRSLRSGFFSGTNLVCESSHKQNEYETVFQFPVKHINLHDKENKFQVETGPVLLFDMHPSGSPGIEQIQTGYLAFNTFDSYEYILQGEHELEKGMYRYPEMTPKRHNALIKIFTSQ